MTPKQRQAIIEAAEKHAVESARAQGLPLVITDPDVLRKIVALFPPELRRAA